MGTRSRRRQHQRRSGGWTPLARGSELAAWLNATAVTLNGSNVSAMRDLSPNGRNFSQGVAANQPTLVASDSAYNGRPVLTTDGDDWLDAIAAWNLVQPVTIYVVGQIGNSADYKTFVDAGAGSRLIVRGTAGEGLSMFGGSANIEPGASIAGPSIVCAVFNGASSAGYVSNVTASITGNPGTGGLGTPRICAAPVGVYPMPSDGKLAEVIYTSVADSAAQRAQMFGFLSRRYGIAVTGL